MSIQKKKKKKHKTKQTKTNPRSPPTPPPHPLGTHTKKQNKTEPRNHDTTPRNTLVVAALYSPLPTRESSKAFSSRSRSSSLRCFSASTWAACSCARSVAVSSVCELPTEEDEEEV